MSATLRLLAARTHVAKEICTYIDRLHALDHDLLMALQAEPPERQQAVLTALGESDDELIERLCAVKEPAR